MIGDTGKGLDHGLVVLALLRDEHEVGAGQHELAQPAQIDVALGTIEVQLHTAAARADLLDESANHGLAVQQLPGAGTADMQRNPYIGRQLPERALDPRQRRVAARGALTRRRVEEAPFRIGIHIGHDGKFNKRCRFIDSGQTAMGQRHGNSLPAA